MTKSKGSEMTTTSSLHQEPRDEHGDGVDVNFDRTVAKDAQAPIPHELDASHANDGAPTPEVDDADRQRASFDT